VRYTCPFPFPLGTHSLPATTKTKITFFAQTKEKTLGITKKNVFPTCIHRYPTVDNDFFLDFIKLTSDLDENVDHVLMVCGRGWPIVHSHA
jgi:hypothetical protein